MVSTPTIRAATPADADPIAAIHVASFRASYGEVLSAATLDALDPAVRAGIWRDRLRAADGQVVVATDGDGVLGFCWFGPTTDDGDATDRVGQVRSIHVSPSANGRGHGGALLRAATRALAEEGRTEATLWVVASNERAKRLYTRAGWRPDGARRREPLGLPGEQAPGVEVLRMRRRLREEDLGGRSIEPALPDRGSTTTEDTDPLADGAPIGDTASPRVPRYYEVKQQLRARIDGLPAGTALPAERVLSGQFSTSRSTVRQALLELAVEGRIVRHQGRGTFVAPPKDVLPLQLRSFTEEWRSRGRTPSSRLLDARTEPAEEDVAAALEITAHTPVFRFERLRFADHTPMAYEVVYLETARFPDLDALMSDQVSLYELLHSRWGLTPTDAQQTMETVPASPQVAGLVQADAGTPMLLLTRTTRDEDGRVFEFVRSLYRGDRYRFLTTLVRPGGPEP